MFLLLLYKSLLFIARTCVLLVLVQSGAGKTGPYRYGWDHIYWYMARAMPYGTGHNFMYLGTDILLKG